MPFSLASGAVSHVEGVVGRDDNSLGRITLCEDWMVAVKVRSLGGKTRDGLSPSDRGSLVAVVDVDVVALGVSVDLVVQLVDEVGRSDEQIGLCWLNLLTCCKL